MHHVFHSGLLIKVIQVKKVSDTLKNPTLLLLILQLVCLLSLPYIFAPSTSVGSFFAQSSHTIFSSRERQQSLP